MTQRILVYRPGSLGDTVVVLPCFHLIRRLYPGSAVRVLTNAPVAKNAAPLFSVMDGSGLIDGCMEYPISLRGVGQMRILAREIRRWRPDLLVYLARRERIGRVWRDALFFKLCGVRKIVGLPLTRDLIRCRRHPDGLYEREAERLARNIASLGAADVRDPANWDLCLTENDRALPRRLIAEQIGAQPFIVLGAGTKQAINDWGQPNWRTVAEGLQQAYGYKLVLVGADGDRALSAAIARDRPAECVDLCGRLTVRESAALIGDAALFVGSDSGPMHLAAAMGTPIVAVFSRLNPPGVWFPFGRQVKPIYPCEPDATVLSIAPEAVLAAVRTLLPAGVAA